MQGRAKDPRALTDELILACTGEVLSQGIRHFWRGRRRTSGTFSSVVVAVLQVHDFGRLSFIFPSRCHTLEL